jgi:hypothetical protein
VEFTQKDGFLISNGTVFYEQFFTPFKVKHNQAQPKQSRDIARVDDIENIFVLPWPIKFNPAIF